MNSRERVLAALNHQQPDRAPVDLSGTRSSGIAAIAYARLRERLGLPPRPVYVYDILQQIAIVDEDVLSLFGVDTIELGRAFALEEKDWADWTLPNGVPCKVPAWNKPERLPGRWVLRSPRGQIIAHMPDGALYFEQTYWPFAQADSSEASERQKGWHENPAEVMTESMWTGVATPPGPLAGGPDGYQMLAEGARKLRQSTGRAIAGMFGGNMLELGQFLYRNDNFFMILASEPKRAHTFLEKATAMYMEKLEKYLAAVGAYIDVILFNDDLGMQSGPQISPRMYRQFFKPHNQAMWRRAKQLAPIKVLLHTCGGVRELLPDLIEDGVDAINPVQISSKGMDAAGLKADFGKDITFWGGGCDTHYVLPHGTPAEVREHVKKQVSILNPGGGFVFQQVHNILADVPADNIIAMYQALQG
jgi:uroporphyrinogen decarboxylase